jgi:hypothetical protein
MTLEDYIRSEYFVRDGGIFTTRGGHTNLTATKLQTDYSRAYPSEASAIAPVDYTQTIGRVLDLHVSELASEAKAREAQINALRSQLASDEEAYIKGVMEAENITPDARYRMFSMVLASGETKMVDSSDIEIALKGRLTEYNRGVTAESGMPRFKKDPVLDRFAYMCKHASNNALAKMQNDLRYDKNSVEKLDQWVEDLIDVMFVTTDREIARVVLKHMMWQVKRRIYGREVKNDLWLGLYGAQGKGKSFIVRNCIFKIFEDFYCETQLSKIDDIDREIGKFRDNFIVNFEELAVGNVGTEERSNKVNKKTMANLKSILTSDTLYIRKMGGQGQMTVPKTFVPISTANEPLYDVIYDESGMRRFFQLDLNPPEHLSTFDVDKVSELAARAEEAWKGVCEWDNEPVWDWNSEVGKKITAIQKGYRPHTTVDDWLEQGNYCADDDVEVACKILYSDYKNFCKESGINYPLARKNFTSNMKRDFKNNYKPGKGDYICISKVKADDAPAPGAPKGDML